MEIRTFYGIISNSMFAQPTLQIHLTSFLVIILVYVDYAKKSNTDPFQRFIFLRALLFAAIALISDLAQYLLSMAPGDKFSAFLYIPVIIYYLFQILSFFNIAIFMDYTIRRKPSKSGKLIAAAWITGNIYMVFLFFFRADIYFIHITLVCVPALIILLEIIFYAGKTAVGHYSSARHFGILPLVWGAAAIGFAADKFAGAQGLIWPCYSAALLCAYLQILRTDSRIDALTGIGNRYAFNQFIDKLSRKVRENIVPCTIVMIDIDHLKAINDQLGHAEGDNALRDMAGILLRSIRHSDFAARYGVDEFILAVPAEYDIEKVMERVRESLQIQNEKNLRPYKLEMSYGHDVYSPLTCRSVDEFLSHVDALMYRDKTRRRRQAGENK